MGPAKWTYYYRYVILDIYNRYVVGWMLAHRESQLLAERLIRETLIKEGIHRDQLTIHSDRGPERFVRGVSRPLTPAVEVWINPPENRPTVRTLELPRDT